MKERTKWLDEKLTRFLWKYRSAFAKHMPADTPVDFALEEEFKKVIGQYATKHNCAKRVGTEENCGINFAIRMADGSYQEINGLRRHSIQKHTESMNPDVLPYVYGANMLMFVIADICNFMNQGDKFMQWASEQGYLKMMIESAVLSDYYLRKYNKGYNHDGIDTPKVYLLCGAFRLFCSYSFPDNGQLTVQLTDAMKSDFARWFHREKQTRCRVLLLRMLSYTDCPTDELKEEIKCTADWKKIFLRYDRIPEYPVFMENPKRLEIKK